MSDLPYRTAPLATLAPGVVCVPVRHGDLVTNAYVVGDDTTCAVIDPAGEVEALREAMAGRRLAAVVATTGHAHHTAAAFDVAAGEAPTFVAAADLPLWQQTHGTADEARPHVLVVDGMTLRVGSLDLAAILVPGHTAGGTVWFCPQRGAVFTGDALGAGGAAESSRVAADLEVLVSAIRARVFTLPGDAVVLPGHGSPVRVATARWNADFWR